MKSVASISLMLFSFLTMANTALAQTLTVTNSSGGNTVEIQGTDRNEIVSIYGDGGPEIFFDVDGDGVFEQTVSNVTQIFVSCEGGEDQTTISGDLNGLGLLWVIPGDGSDVTTISGRIGSDFLHIEDRGDGDDLVEIEAHVGGFLLVSQDSGEGTVLIRDTSVGWGVNFQSNSGDDTFWVEQSHFPFVVAGGNNDSRTIFKFDNVVAPGGMRFTGDVRSSGLADELRVAVTNCDIGSTLKVYGAENVTDLVLRDSEIGEPGSADGSIIETYQGVDTILLDNVTLYSGLEVNTGRGSDFIDLLNGAEIAGDLTINSGVHADTINFDGVDTQHLIHIGGNLVVNTGTHNDEATFSNVRVQGTVNLSGGFGWDSFAWSETICEGDWSVDLFNGNDTLQVTNSAFNSQFNAFGGSHTDTGIQANNDYANPPVTSGFEIGNLQ